ncbi:MAG: hypothetical protein CL801_08410 [Citromicrobium sp.]|nr:hypothetical protein [Citromicrobium sp.]
MFPPRTYGYYFFKFIKTVAILIVVSGRDIRTIYSALSGIIKLGTRGAWHDILGVQLDPAFKARPFGSRQGISRHQSDTLRQVIIVGTEKAKICNPFADLFIPDVSLKLTCRRFH